ncbi:MAG: dihydroorotate dehydrogenase [Eubacteriales bacterium]|nr:dihydroorotate dehydrogenase [Eubacteriales bacterium]
MVNTSITLCGVTLSNPVIAASGTFGFGEDFAKLYDINCLGSFSMKGTTLLPREGNPTPRIAECACGMLNAVGLQNPGIDKVISEELPKIAEFYHKPVMANVSGFSVDEYAEVCRRLNDQAQVGWIELNISCPNVHGGGLAFGTSPQAAGQVTKAARRATKKPLIVKLSPNVTDIAEVARACEAEGADGLSLINTLLGMRLDLKTRRPVLNNITGGLSGPAVFPVALRMVYQVYEAVCVPLLGIGGISSAADVLEMMLAGATAVQVGSANLINPCACRDIIEALPATMAEYGVKDLKDMIGGAH